MTIARITELTKERYQTGAHARTMFRLAPDTWQEIVASHASDATDYAGLSDSLTQFLSIPAGVDHNLSRGAWQLRDQFDQRILEEGSILPSDAAQLSRLLWDAREAIDMFAAVTNRRAGTQSRHLLSLVAEIDQYRADRGWSPNGYGGEQ